ncbi:MAG TPA: hypothetical protein VL832_21060 [Puia sp.]|jgi:hypothetical protein|nr:hypothetical protein [Puia sp.]
MEPPSWPARFNRLRQLFWLFLLLTIAYMIWMRNYLSPLSSGEIVQFEIAKTVDRAHSIINEWKNTGKYELGVKSTYFAYFFIILYTIAIALACRFISSCTGNDILIKGGRGFAWLIVVASICDVIENMAMSRTLQGTVSQWNVSIAYNLARVKFSIVIVCVLFALACALYWVIARLAGEEK